MCIQFAFSLYSAPHRFLSSKVSLNLICMYCFFFLTFRCIPAVAAPCNWEELASSHKELNVCDPDALAGKNNVLTYLNDGNYM